ncbi:hypothetical protein AMTR_s00033p00101470 [Amborella trichopoda]|uniref:Uncharacterized protein n=1 Tax=Amborella trichopoda TaxID=13333 RepID=U5CM54_AMBTC|nr:hypothetical protein AMTR_s00033p00101470 [Amborella trichopoda]
MNLAANLEAIVEFSNDLYEADRGPQMVRLPPVHSTTVPARVATAHSNGPSSESRGFSWSRVGNGTSCYKSQIIVTLLFILA